MNNFSAVGRVGRDAVTRFTQAGKAVTGWALAVDSGWGDNKKTTWLDCTLWGDRGQKLAEHIRKGDRLGVVGEIGTREHEGKTYVKLDVKDVTLLGGRQEGQSGGTSSRKVGQERVDRKARIEEQRPPVDDFADSDIPF